MLSFKTFISEATMTATAGSEKGDYHVQKYLNPQTIKTSKYKLAKEHGGLKAGTEVSVHKVTQENGKHIAHLSHPDLKGEHKVPINQLHKPSGVGRGESQAENHHLGIIHKAIEDAKKESGSDEITLHTPHGQIKAASIHKVAGTPKADFEIKDKHGNTSYYISHKAGATPKDFQQWGGISKHTDHPAVKEFAKSVKEKHPHGVTGTVGQELDMNNPDHNKLAHQAVFGPEHGSKTYSKENVHSVYGGKMTLQKIKPGHYKLGADTVIPNIHGKNSLGGKRILLSARKGDRNDLGINKTRVTINPVGGRKTKDLHTGSEIK